MTIAHPALPSLPWLLLAAAVSLATDDDAIGLDTRTASSEAREREAARAYRLARRVRIAARQGETLIPCPDGETSQAPRIAWDPARYGMQQTGIDLSTLGQQTGRRHNGYWTAAGTRCVEVSAWTKRTVQAGIVHVQRAANLYV